MAEFEQLGPYALGRLLGQGGMGAVYAAIDTGTGESVAVKLLGALLAADEGFRTRFEGEIESLKKLRHPNIVRLYGYGEQGGALYYAMELVPGPSLEEELRRGRTFTWRATTDVAIQLCRALKHAHDHGIVHRDIKPANLLLAPDGQVKLSDFGIARLFGNTRMTRDGGILGTAEYMSPEQAEGRAVTDRCDQYSLGCVLYALLSGRAPFQANSFVDMLQKQRFAEPEPLRRLVPDCPEPLERIIKQLLEKDPQARFANILMLGRSLEAMQHALGQHKPDEIAPSEPTRVPNLASLAATVVPEATGIDGDSDDYELAVPEPSATIAAATRPEAGRTPRPTPRAAEAPEKFTKVEEETPTAPAWQQDLVRTLSSPQTWVLAAILICTIAGLAYALWPISAEQLVRRIDRQIATGPEGLAAAESDLRLFLQRFPNEPRSGVMQDWLDEIELARRNRQLKVKSRSTRRSVNLSTTERLLAETTQLAVTHPEEAIRKLQSLIDVFDAPQADAETREFVELARQELARLEAQAAGDRAVQQRLIAEQLQRADELAATDPASARRIWQGVVELYADKSWAAALVERSRAGLSRTAAAATSDPSHTQPSTPQPAVEK